MRDKKTHDHRCRVWFIYSHKRWEKNGGAELVACNIVNPNSFK